MSITRRTVLVLGAGASQPYGFPLGPALRDIICAQTTDFRSQITLRSFGFERGEIDAFGTALRHSGFGSIDAFLEAEPRFTSLGKVAIALALLPRERPSALFPPAAPKKGHWYEYLLSITAGSLKEWAANRLTIASFNYDRSFEHYFVTVLAQRFKVSKADAAKLLRRVEVIHLHGQLGAYPGLGAAPVPYDPDSVSSDDVRRAARSITTTFEGTADSPFTRVGKRIALKPQIS